MKDTRLFNMLVVIGSGVWTSATACGRSQHAVATGGANAAGAATGGSSATGGSDAMAGSDASGGSGATGGSPTAGGPATGGASGTESSAGTNDAGFGAGDPGPTAQWNCTGKLTECDDTSGRYVTPSRGAKLAGDCPVETDRPRTTADCPSGTRLSCALALDASGTQELVNCMCETAASLVCGQCTSLVSGRQVDANCSTGMQDLPLRRHRHPEVTEAARTAGAEGDTTARALAALDPAQRGLLAAYFRERARGELTTALSFEFMLSDLVGESFPAELVAMARQAISDEQRHAELCLAWARRVAPDEPANPELSGMRPLEIDGANARENRILRTVFGCCFSETIAVCLLRESQEVTTLPAARALNREHLADEVRHSRLGWGLVSWPGLATHDRDMIGRFVPELLRLTRLVWTVEDRPADPSLLAFGYLASSLVESAREKAIDEVILPGLEQFRIRG